MGQSIKRACVRVYRDAHTRCVTRHPHLNLAPGVFSLVTRLKRRLKRRLHLRIHRALQVASDTAVLICTAQSQVVNGVNVHLTVTVNGASCADVAALKHVRVYVSFSNEYTVRPE